MRESQQIANGPAPYRVLNTGLDPSQQGQHVMASMDEDSGSHHHEASIQALEEEEEEGEEEEQQHSSDLAFSEQRKRWEDEQDELKVQLVMFDDFPWMMPPSPSEPLRYIAGIDISFWKKDPCVACAAIVVIDMCNNMSVIYQDYEILTLTIPYIPGFLAFRECPVLLRLLKKLHETELGIYPQLLMVDGNGILHPRGFGLACHVGVLADIPTIGVAKNLHHVDGLCKKELHIGSEGESGCVRVLKGRSGQILGMALRSHAKCKNPIFVSVGHRVSLQTAVELVQLCCKYRIPEPVRQADIKSREKLRQVGQKR